MERVEEITGRIAQRLRERRAELGLTQRDLAESLGMSEAYLSSLETGQVTTQLRRLVEALDAVGLELLALPRTHPVAAQERAQPIAWPRSARRTHEETMAELRNVLVHLDTSRVANPELAERLASLQGLAREPGFTLEDSGRAQRLMRPLFMLATSNDVLAVADTEVRRLLLAIRRYTDPKYAADPEDRP